MTGRVGDDQGRPVVGATVMFASVQPRGPFSDEGRTVTDTEGRFTADLSQLPWARSELQARVLAPGFRAMTGPIEAGAGKATVDFALAPAPWKTTEVRLIDPAGRPLVNVEWTCEADVRVSWGRVRTDGDGRCRVAMAPNIYLTMDAAPAGLRPIKLILDNKVDDPGTIAITAPPPITGRVVDLNGQPVANAAVGRMILAVDGKPKLLPHFYSETSSTDGEGRFALRPTLLSRSIDRRDNPPSFPTDSICVADPEFRRLSFQLVNLSRLDRPIEIHLADARPVTIPLAYDFVLPAPRSNVTLNLMVRPEPTRPEVQLPFLIQAFDADGEAGCQLTVALPPGQFALRAEVAGPATNELAGLGNGDLAVPEGIGIHMAMEMAVRSPRRVQGIGKPAPEIEATDLDTQAPVRLADFRGRVVILDFWGYWCGPCLAAMPELVKLQEYFEGKPVTILSLHDASVRSRDELTRQLAGARDNLWKGRDLPLRILVDRPDPAVGRDEASKGTGATIRRYRVVAFPTLLVIDQDGNRAGSIPAHDRAKLQALIQTLLDKKSPP